MAAPQRSTPSRRDDFHKLRSRARLWSVSTWLIGACVAVHVLVGFFWRGGVAITPWGAFTAEDTFVRLQLWRPLTFQFLHAGLLHLGLNCLGLWFFGPFVERRFGRARTLVFYLVCGLGGAAGFLFLWGVGLISASASTPLIGASAGVFGLIAGAMRLVPHRILNLALPPIDITVFRFGLVYLSVAAFTVIAYGGNAYSNAGGEAAHLGGAAIGYVLAAHSRWFAWADRLVPRALRAPGSRATPSDVKPPSYMKYHGWR